MALPFLEIRDILNATIEHLEFGAILAGQISDVKTIRVWNDYGSKFLSDIAKNFDP